MSTKFKIQVSKSLDNRIKEFVADRCETSIDKAYILGFTNGNTLNYVGLSRSLDLNNPIYAFMGYAYFKNKPSEDELATDLQALKNHLASLNDPEWSNIGQFLVYTPDEGTTVSRTIRSLELQCAPDSKLKISVIDESKLINHSALSMLKVSLSLDIYKHNSLSLDPAKIACSFENIESNLSKISGRPSPKLLNSKITFESIKNLTQSTESLYEYLNPPADAIVLGDYLPQGMSKKEKEENVQKLADKWRNKHRERRGPLEFELKLADEAVSNDCLNLDMTLYFYSHINSSLYITMKRMLDLVRYSLCSLRYNLTKIEGKPVEKDSVYFCTFKPMILDHLVHQVYIIPKVEANYDELEDMRLKLHHTYLAPEDRPLFRVRQRFLGATMSNEDLQKGLLSNVHSSIIEKSGIKDGSLNIIRGTYTYHHYMQDNINDNGWGCAYRSLQTIISWFKHQGYIYSMDAKPYRPKKTDPEDKLAELRTKLELESRVPSHEEIQRVLVDVGDKTPDFVNSKKWIGSQEVCYVLDHLFGIQSKFIAVSSGSELVSKARDLGAHFATQFTPIMIGGGVLAHTIIGTNFNEKNGDISYLILDPHYTDSDEIDKILKKGWCGWKKNSFWDKSAFYNLCLPQRPIVI